VRASRLSIAAGVVLVGLCAALPFRQRQPRSRPPAPSAAPLELALRQPDAPLQLAPRADISPAASLDPIAMRRAPDSGPALTSLRTPDLMNLAPPPSLPVAFQPSERNSPPSDWRPDSLARSAKPPGKPRQYRLRDGDTLEKIAERFLGTRERAGEIFEANRDVLARPDLLPVGFTIVIPPREQVGDLEPFSR
jgi:nucleoid-associated protein YgaU